MADNSFRIDKSVSLAPQASAPANPRNGDIYYNTTLGFQRYEGGAWLPFGSTGVTFDVVLGETVAAFVPIYISKGSATDSGRTLGRAYQLDNTNLNRIEFAGFTTEGGIAGDTVTIQIGGELDGFTGLSQGSPYYSSGVGTFSATSPTALNNWIIQLGMASGTTKLLINGAGSATAVKITSQLSTSVYPDFTLPLKWVADSNVGTNPVGNAYAMSFANNVDGTIYSEIVVPDNYITGTEMSMVVPFAVAATGNLYFTVISDLYRSSSVDAFAASPTGTRTANYTIATPSTSNLVKTDASIKLTDTTGRINSISVSPRDIIVVKLQRTASSGLDTAEAALNMFDPQFSYKGGSLTGSGNSEYISAGFQNFVGTTYLTAINGSPSSSQFRSDITNRRQVINLGDDMLPKLGVDRFPFQTLALITDEFGPSTQSVFKPVNDFKEQFRFVGNWTSAITNNGVYVTPSLVTTDYMEVIFYGTALNLMILASGGPYDLRASVDGAAEGANFLSGSAYSSALGARNYSTNQIVSVTSGLALGVHTVKIRQASASTNPAIYGVEAVTSATTLQVPTGTTYISGAKVQHVTAEAIAYGSTFESGTLGTRGGRVLAYLKSTGAFAKAVTPANPAQANLASADHTNEEVARVYNFREFSANRSDDFVAQLASGSASFTLEDGSTVLCVNGVSTNSGNSLSENIVLPNTGAAIAFIFVGTGLDFIRADSTVSGTTFVDTFTVTVDGSSIGTITGAAISAGASKVVSGLPYGTHVVRITRSGATGGTAFGILGFRVFQPRKPTLPSDAIEIADYNIPADFVANTVAGVDTVATGVVRKILSQREGVFTGTWSVSGSPTDAGIISQFAASTSTSGDYVEYTFFGTGFEYRGRTTATRSNNISLSLNGLAATTANYATLVSSVYGGPAFAAGVLNMNAATQDAAGLRISGLPLARYTVRFTNNTSSLFSVDGFDVIMPIHSIAEKSSLLLQNTGPIGSQSILDTRKTRAVKESDLQIKNSAQAVGMTASPSTSSTSAVQVPDMSVVLKTTSNKVRVTFWSQIAGASSSTNWVVYVDGVPQSPINILSPYSSGFGMISMSMLIPVAPGVHKYAIHWYVGGGTGSQVGTNRLLTVEEA